MANEEKTTIENLRKDLENEHRFTSVWRGYNKKEVKNITTILSIYDKNITKTATHNQIYAAKEKIT